LQKICLTMILPFWQKISPCKKDNANSWPYEAYQYWPIGWLHTVTRENNKQDLFGYYLDGELKIAYYDVTATPPTRPCGGEMPLPDPGSFARPGVTRGQI
jgi:hypothetical protein